jgi:probable HAF family extracellular repeat protein
MQDLGTLPGGSGSCAIAINNTAETVGNSFTTGGYTHAFLYSGGQMQDLGVLGYLASYANGINAAGQVVGYIAKISTDHPFLYSGGKMQDLGTLGGALGLADGINSAGQVVGGADTTSGALHAFLYSGGTMTDLNTLIDPSSGWTLQEATAINAAGQIVGAGLNSARQSDAFLLTPVPEPATSSLLVLGALALLRRRK